MQRINDQNLKHKDDKVSPDVASKVEPPKNVDQEIVADNDISPHYKLGDEHEPIDLTHLNIEAAILCLASKVT